MNGSAAQEEQEGRRVRRELGIVLLVACLAAFFLAFFDPHDRLTAYIDSRVHSLIDKIAAFFLTLALALAVFSLRRWRELQEKLLRLKGSEETLRRKHALLQELMEVIPNPVYYKDLDLVYRGCNKAFIDAFVRCGDVVVGKTAFNLSSVDRAEFYEKMDRALLKHPCEQVIEGTVAYTDGQPHNVVFNKAIYTDGAGNPAGIIGVITDVTELKTLETQFRESEALFKTLAESSLIGVALYGETFIYANPTMQNIAGYTLDELLHIPPWDIFLPQYREEVREAVQKRLAGEDFPVIHTESQIVTKQGELKWVQRYAQTVEYRGGFAALANFIDVTDRKKLEEKLQTMAATDRLTGICNRSRLEEIIAAETERSRRYGTPLSLIMYDLDHFKRVNDGYGHAAGDAVLKETAQIVRDNIRKSDTVGRWGGEEFIIVVPETGLEQTRELAEKLRLLIGEASFGIPHRVSASFGVGEFDRNESSFELIKRADDALYRAKRNGRNRVEKSVPDQVFC